MLRMDPNPNAIWVPFAWPSLDAAMVLEGGQLYKTRFRLYVANRFEFGPDGPTARPKLEQEKQSRLASQPAGRPGGKKLPTSNNIYV